MTHRQGSSSNSLQGIFNFDHEPNENSVGLDQQNVVLPNASVHDGSTVTGWRGQSSFSENPQNRFRILELLGVGIDQRSEETRSEPNIHSFQESLSMSLGNAQVTNGQSILQGSGSRLHPHNIDLNATYGGNDNDTNQDMGAGLGLQTFKPGGQDGDQNPPASASSNSLMISSGIAGYVLEENDHGEGLPSDGRRLSCKRRAPEDASGQLSLGGSSSTAQQAGNSEQEGLTAQENALTAQENAHGSLTVSGPLNINPNVDHSEQLDTELAVGLAAASFLPQPSSVAGQAENFQRNIRLRRAGNQQDFVPASLSTQTQGNSNMQSASQAAVFFPFDRFPSSSSAPVVCAIPAHLHGPNSLQTLQLSQSLNGVNSSGASGSFLPPASHQEENPRNNPRNIPELERGNVALVQTNLTLGNGNTNLPGNMVSTSLNGSSSGNHQPPPSWFPQQNIAEQYEQRVTDIVNRSESQRQGNYCPIHSGGSSASREMEFSVRGGNARPSQISLRSGVMARAERQDVAYPEIPPGLRSMTPAQRRSRLVSEVRNALAVVRRGSSLRLEDVMIIDRSVLLRVPEENDIHEDMRLDVDRMTYEELLALEDHIGNVCTGLTEAAILSHLKRRKYQSIAVEPHVEHEPCCICQEDYANGDDLGKLDCGHDFHFNCIKQWLMQKNLCPICKMTALAL